MRGCHTVRNWGWTAGHACVLTGVFLIVAGVYLLAGAGWAVLCLGIWLVVAGAAVVRTEAGPR